MRFFQKTKDGGKDSPVDGYFLVEVKGLFSIALLKFNKGRRESFHTHAFNAYTWFLHGELYEEELKGDSITYTKYKKSLIPKMTPKDNNHRVKAQKDSWCFTVRGPWDDTWTEDNLNTNTKTTFTHGRKIISKEPRYL